MSPLLDAFWRAAAYCLHPRVIFLSVLPLVLIGLVAAGVGYWLWSPLVAMVQISCAARSIAVSSFQSMPLTSNSCLPSGSRVLTGRSFVCSFPAACPSGGSSSGATVSSGAVGRRSAGGLSTALLELFQCGTRV